MVGYLRSCVPIAFVPHSPRMLSGVFVGAVPPWTTADMTWDVEMDQTSVPDTAHWDGVLDDNVTPVASFLWIDGFTLRVTWNYFPAPTVSAFTRLLTVDDQCKDLVGNLAMPNQTIQWLP